MTKNDDQKEECAYSRDVGQIAFYDILAVNVRHFVLRKKSENISYQNYLLNVDKFQSDPALPTKLNLTWQDSTQSL